MRSMRAAACVVLVALVVVGCRRSRPEAAPEPEPMRLEQMFSEQGIAEVLSTASRVAVGDMDGDGRPELVIADAYWLRVVDLAGQERARFTAPGGIQVLRLADVDGDGRAEILAGWGRSREHLDAAARLAVYRVSGGELVEDVIAAPATGRPEVVEMLVAGERQLVVAYFVSKYMVNIARADELGGRWALSDIGTVRMATRLALGDVDGDGKADLVVGRVYGDELEAEGDAFVLRPDGSRVPIPVTGGVRSLAVADVDGDGVAEVWLGDGWNRNYGQLARALLTRASWDGEAFRAELVEDAPGQFVVWDIVIADLDGDGRLEIVTRGNAQVRVLTRAGGGWHGAVVASACRDAVAAELDGRPGAELLVVCDSGAGIVRGAGASEGGE